MSDDKKEQISFGPELPDGRRLAFRRQGGEERVGIVGPLEDGKPLPEGSEILHVDNSDHGRECDGWHDAEVIYRHGDESAEPEPAQTQAHSGPSRVATPAYRDGWSRIFRKKEVGLA